MIFKKPTNLNKKGKDSDLPNDTKMMELLATLSSDTCAILELSTLNLELLIKPSLRSEEILLICFLLEKIISDSVQMEQKNKKRHHLISYFFGQTQKVTELDRILLNLLERNFFPAEDNFSSDLKKKLNIWFDEISKETSMVKNSSFTCPKKNHLQLKEEIFLEQVVFFGHFEKNDKIASQFSYFKELNEKYIETRQKIFNKFQPEQLYFVLLYLLVWDELECLTFQRNKKKKRAKFQNILLSLLNPNRKNLSTDFKLLGQFCLKPAFFEKHLEIANKNSKKLDLERIYSLRQLKRLLSYELVNINKDFTTFLYQKDAHIKMTTTLYGDFLKKLNDKDFIELLSETDNVELEAFKKNPRTQIVVMSLCVEFLTFLGQEQAKKPDWVYVEVPSFLKKFFHYRQKQRNAFSKASKKEL